MCFLCFLYNFNELIPISIFIKYADIDSGNLTTGTSLSDLLLQFCLDNPAICNPEPKIIYRGENDTAVNVTISTRQLNDLFAYMFDQGDDFNVFRDFMKSEIEPNRKRTISGHLTL